MKKSAFLLAAFVVASALCSAAFAGIHVPDALQLSQLLAPDTISSHWAAIGMTTLAANKMRAFELGNRNNLPVLGDT